MATGHFDKWIDKSHHGKNAAELGELDLDALKGASADDKQHLQDAFGVATIEEFASNRFVRAAISIVNEANNINHDPGPNVSWSRVFADAPLSVYQDHPREFRLDFGPAYYRGRLDGTARVLVIGQDPAANELIGHRIFVGTSGQRIQGFLRRIGIQRDYVMVNTYLYPVFGQFFGTLRDLTENADILGFRNRMLDKIKDENSLEAVIAVGAAGRDSAERWPGSADLHVQHITHPSARDHEELLTNWNEGLTALRAIVDPESDAVADDANYGDDFVDADQEPIPRRDLPFGVPEWHGNGTRATRGRTADDKTDHKRIIWKAP